MAYASTQNWAGVATRSTMNAAVVRDRTEHRLSQHRLHWHVTTVKVHALRLFCSCFCVRLFAKSTCMASMSDHITGTTGNSRLSDHKVNQYTTKNALPRNKLRAYVCRWAMNKVQ